MDAEISFRRANFFPCVIYDGATRARYSVIRVSDAECVCGGERKRRGGGGRARRGTRREHQPGRLNLSTERGRRGGRGSSRTEPGALLCARGRKYFNTDACNIKGAKAVPYGHHSSARREADWRVGRTGARPMGAHTRVKSLSTTPCARVHTYTGAHPEDLCCLSSRAKGADVYGRTGNHLLGHRFPPRALLRRARFPAIQL